MSEIPLLYTKFLIPRLGENIFSRPRISTWIENNLDKRLILLSAPAGYGKTTALVDILDGIDRPYAWCQIDSSDGDPTTFLTSLIEAIRDWPSINNPNGQMIGQTARILLGGSDPNFSPQQVLTVLINDLYENAKLPAIIILDDYHNISNPAVHNLVEFLLENLPPGLCLIISTRVDPPLMLARFRVRGQLAELRTPALRFRDDEIKAWSETCLPGLSSDLISKLSEKTEGWAAALQIVRSSWCENDPQDLGQLILNLTGSQRFIFEFLADEVFRRLPIGEQDFLLRTSILPQLNVSACKALTEIKDTQNMLEHLERQNLFLISLDPQNNWYRYHFLFREFLLNRLERDNPELYKSQQLKAGNFYAEQNEFEAALSYYLTAQDYESSTAMIIQFAEDVVERGRVDAIQQYLSEIPESVIQKNPKLLLICGNVYLRKGQIGTAMNAIADAKDEFTRQGQYAGISRALTTLSEIYRSQGNYKEALNLSSEAVVVAPLEDHAIRSEALIALAKCTGFLTGMDQGRALAEQAVEESRQAGELIGPVARANLLQSLGQICWWHGDPHATVQYCEEALRLVKDDFSPTAAKANISLASPYLYWRDFSSALKYAERGLEIAQTLNLKELIPSAYTVLGNVLTRLGETARAENCLRQAMKIGQQIGVASYEHLMAAGYLALNLCQQGRVDEAQQLAEGALWAHSNNPDTYEAFVCRSVLADVALEKQELYKAKNLYEELVKVGERRQFKIPLSLVNLGLAYIFLNSDQKDLGLDYARRSLKLIEPTQAIQLFLDQGERARLVCQALSETHETTPFVQKVLDNYLTISHNLHLTESSTVFVNCLGNFTVRVGDEVITQDRWVSSKARDLLAYFVTNRRDRITADQVFEAIWSDKPGRGLAAFHTALTRLRNALRGDSNLHRFILVESGDYLLDSARFVVDVDEFDNALAKARAAVDARIEANWYQKAVDVYHGEFLQNLYYDWLMAERQRLTMAYLGALKALADYHYDNSRYIWSLEMLQRALRIDNLQEDVHCQLMRVFAALDDRAGLIHHYNELTEILHDELGLDPSPVTKRLYEQLIHSKVD